MFDKLRGHLREISAAVVLGLIIAAVVIWRSRVSSDFWPLDASRVGPNLLASLVQWAIIFVAAALLYPPFRRAVARAAHRFVDGKLDVLHKKVDDLKEHHARAQAHHEWTAKHIAQISKRLELDVEDHPHFDIGRKKE